MPALRDSSAATYSEPRMPHQARRRSGENQGHVSARSLDPRGAYVSAYPPSRPGHCLAPRPPSPGKRQNAPSLGKEVACQNKQFWQNLIALDAQIATFGCFCPFDSPVRVPRLTAAESMLGCQLLALWDALWREHSSHPIGCRACPRKPLERCPVRSQ